MVGIGEGVQQQLMNAVRVPAAPIHQRDEDVGHASRAGQDEPRCRIGNAFVHLLRRESSRVQSRVLTPRWKKKRKKKEPRIDQSEPYPTIPGHSRIYAKQTDAGSQRRLEFLFPPSLPKKFDLQPNS